MVDCNEVLREIELYLDDELESGMCRPLEEHLAECGSCLQRKEFRATLKVLVAKKCGSDLAPDALRSKILELLASEPPPG